MQHCLVNKPNAPVTSNWPVVVMIVYKVPLWFWWQSYFTSCYSFSKSLQHYSAVVIYIVPNFHISKDSTPHLCQNISPKKISFSFYQFTTLLDFFLCYIASPFITLTALLIIFHEIHLEDSKYLTASNHFYPPM